jgi:hypothetical protein
MPGWNGKRFAAYGLLAGLGAGLQVGCHRATKPDDLTQPPQLSYQTQTIVATQNVPYTSVVPDAQAWVYTLGVGSWVYSGFTFAVQPPLPGGLSLDSSTGVISGTPAATTDGNAPYNISVNNSITSGTYKGGGGTTTFQVSLGVQASSPVTLDYAGTGAVSTVVGGSVALNPPVVGNGTATGFGISPALPAGLTLNILTGAITGSPTAVSDPAGNYLLTVTTPTGSANAPLTLLVLPVSALPVAAPLGLSYPALGTVTAGTPYTSPAPTLTAPATAVVYTVVDAAANPLPQGLALNPLSGVISGTPAVAGTTLCTIAASNAGGNSQVDLTITVGN